MWEKQDVDGSSATQALLREKQMQLFGGCRGRSSWDALVLFCSLGAEIALLMFNLLNIGGLPKRVGSGEVGGWWISELALATKPLGRLLGVRLQLFFHFGGQEKRTCHIPHSFIQG